VAWLAEQGVRQFLDVGSGLPTDRNTHEVAQAVDSTCRVVYVDNDSVVLTHARALLRDDGVATGAGDLADPAAILASPGVPDPNSADVDSAGVTASRNPVVRPAGGMKWPLATMTGDRLRGIVECVRDLKPRKRRSFSCIFLGSDGG
jgi:hypothetical protein